MSATSKIEWTEKTWNPVRGCSVISPGCVNCYAMKQAHRFSGVRIVKRDEMPQYAVLGIGPESWVDLESAERYAVDHKHTDRSHVSIRVGTLRLVMKVLRAIRLDDFRAAPVPQGERAKECAAGCPICTSDEGERAGYVCELPECAHRVCGCGDAECGHANENVQPNCSECGCSGFRPVEGERATERS